MLLCNCLLLVQKRSDGARVYEGLWLRASDASYSLWMIESGERDNPGYRATCVKGDDSATKLKGPDAIPMYQQRTLNDGLLWDPESHGAEAKDEVFADREPHCKH